MNSITWEERAKALWQLLDDIDTADDACREHDRTFRERVRALVKRRHGILVSDGHVLSVSKGHEAPPPEAYHFEPANHATIRRIGDHRSFFGSGGPTTSGKGPLVWVGTDAKERAQRVLDEQVNSGALEPNKWEVVRGPLS